MNDDTFEIDEVMENSTNIDVTIKDSPDNYADEWLTTNYIANVFKAIKEVLKVLQNDMQTMKARDRNGIYVAEVEPPTIDEISKWEFSDSNDEEGDDISDWIG